MTAKESQLKLETEIEILKQLEALKQWELVKYWESLPQENMYIAREIFGTCPALEKKVIGALKRASQYHVKDTVIFLKDYQDTEQTLPKGTIGTINRMSYYHEKPWDYISIDILIESKKVTITKDLAMGHHYPLGLCIKSIDGYWHWSTL
jgi:hypothetical protein